MDALLAGLIGKLNLGVERSATMLSDRFGASTRALTQTMVTEVASLRSDMRVEVATLRRESIKAVTALLDDVAAQRKSLADERKEFAKSKQLASNRHWLVLLPSGKYICLTCEIHHHSLQPHEHGSRFMDSPFLQRNGGLMVDANFEQRAEPLQFALRLQEVEADAVTRRIFRTVLDSILHYRSFLEHESICFLQSENGVEMGDRLHSRRTAASALETIYTVQREHTRTFLVTPNVYTHRRPYVGIAADKVCDKQFSSWQIANGRANLVGTPVQFIMELRAITSTLADGTTCLSEMDASADGVGIEAKQRATYCFDGEACYQGEVTAVKHQLLKRPETKSVWHDPPHANELLNGDMRSEVSYIEMIHEIVRQIYSYYSRSPKRLRGLVAVASQLGEDYAQLHYVFEVRMVESETVALKNFLTDVPAIVADLQETIDGAAGTAADKSVQISKCRAWLKQIKQFKFVAVIIVLLDTNEVSRTFSKATQADDGLAIDVPQHRTRLITTLTARRDGALGVKLARNLRQLCSGKFQSVELLGVPQTEGEREASAADAASTLPAELAHAPDDEIWPVEAIIDHKPVDSEDETIGALAVDAIAKLKADLGEHPAFLRVLAYQRAICESLLRHLPTRLVIPEVVSHLATITDFRLMPLLSTPEAHTALETWGNDSIDWLVANVLTHLDAGVLKSEALRVRSFVRDHKAEWMLEHNVFGEDGKVMGTECRLTLTGAESIAHTLFVEPERVSGGVPPQFLEVLDFMIAFRYNQSDTERVGRTMTLTKPALRASLGPDHFKQACWVAFNSPGFHEVDIQAFVRRWIADGKLSALMKDRNAERAREVLERKAREHKASFLTKGMEV